jgi:hypothetical protein
MRNNFPCGNKFKFETRFKLNILEKTAFEFEPILLEAQTGLEKSDKFPKILICPSLLDCELTLGMVVWQKLKFPYKLSLDLI